MLKWRLSMNGAKQEVMIWCLLGTLMFFLDERVTGGNIPADLLVVSLLVIAVYVRSPEF
jgi:hypothetical protein